VIPLVIASCSKLGPAAEGYLQSLATVEGLQELLTTAWGCVLLDNIRVVLWSVVVVLCSITMIVAWQRVLGKIFATVPLWHSNEMQLKS
jgi:beta-lactamase regulating signal transducer with metallopeptidase domain